MGRRRCGGFRTLWLAAVAALPGAVPGSVAAAIPLSLDEVVRRVLRSSPAAQEIAGNVELAALDLERARTEYRFRPYAFVNTDARSGAELGQTFRAGVTRRLAGGSRWTFGASNASFGDSNLSELTVGYTLPLFQDPVSSGRFSRDDAELGFRTRHLQAVIATEDLVLQTIALYYEVALAAGSVQVAEGATALAERLERATAIRVRSGRSSELDRQLAGLRVAESRQHERAANAALTAAENRLRILLGLPRDTPVVVEADIPLTADGGTALLDETALAERALSRRNDIRALQEETALARTKAATPRTRFPGLNLSLQYALVGEGTSFSESSNLDEGRFGLGLAVDLARQGSLDEESRRLYLQYQSRRRALERLEAEVQAEVEAGLFTVRDAAARLRLARQNRILNQQQLRLAETLYEQGTGTTEDMLERQQRLAEARQQELAARVQVLMANYRLLAATGSLLEQWQD